MSKNKHMTLETRYKIEHGLDESLSFKAIAAEIGKDCTTVSKEVRGHIISEKKGAPYRIFNDCINRTHCRHFGDVCKVCTRKNKKKCSGSLVLPIIYSCIPASLSYSIFIRAKQVKP